MPAQADESTAAESARTTALKQSVRATIDDPANPPSTRPAEEGEASEQAAEECSEPEDGAALCVQVVELDAAGASALEGPANLAAPVPFPTWCRSSDVIGTRTQACTAFIIILTTTTTVNGTTTVTGRAELDTYSFNYTSVDNITFAHQLGFITATGYGPAMTATVTGLARHSGACTTDSYSFPPQLIAPEDSWHIGEAFFTTTATADGTRGRCMTIWDLAFTVPNHGTTRVDNNSLDEVRCDEAGAHLQRPKRPGCVIFWYASAVTYSQSAYPSLTSHVSRAQASGLPGATFANPLKRSTNANTIRLNRQLACGDAPSIDGRNCDECPLATTYNGMAAGGARRTFAGCDMNAPTGVTGPSGASACMITASENFAQGGLHSAFYYDWRVLDFDPYRVEIGA